MLCEFASFNNFFLTWAILTVLSFTGMCFFSGLIFYAYYYKRPSLSRWQQKSNPQFPSPEKVREEIITMGKGVAGAVLCPTITLYLSAKGLSNGYCGIPGEFGWGYFIFSIVVVWVGSDFFEFFYHRLGHTQDFFWSVHRHHHKFWNPTPFAVVADEYLDQLVRASPLLIFPMLMPVNMDMMFFVYAMFFYVYGVYLHWGYEFNYPDAHHPYINTSFQHYLHHAVSIKGKPYHTGFFFKIWDNLCGSVYKESCFCCKCETKKGNRDVQHYERIMAAYPDYTKLLSPHFWLYGGAGEEKKK